MDDLAEGRCDGAQQWAQLRFLCQRKLIQYSHVTTR
jgi:hypothetical protein